MIGQQHSALLLYGAGGTFEVGKRTTPTPGPGQVLVHNKAVALNPADPKIHKTGVWLSAYGWPIVLGQDGAGEIVALGSDVHGWAVGDKVFYQSYVIQDRGTFQEYTIADAARIARVPAGLSYEEAATIPLGIATAAIGMYEPKSNERRTVGQARSIGGAGLTPPWETGGRGKYAGQAAVVVGGSSSVGQFAIQLAKLSGFSPIVTTAAKHNEAYCKAAGATHVIDYHDVPYEELPSAVTGILGNAPLTLFYDAISEIESQNAGWEMLGQDGSMVIVNPPSDLVAGKQVEGDERGRRLVWVLGVVNDPDHEQFGTRMYAALTEMFEKGELKPNAVENIGHSLGVIPSGLEKLQQGVSGVKLVASL